MANSILFPNHALSDGGGAGSSSGTGFRYCTFYNNTSGGNGGGLRIGLQADHTHWDPPSVMNCLFMDNIAGNAGGTDGDNFYGENFATDETQKTIFSHNLVGGTGIQGSSGHKIVASNNLTGNAAGTAATVFASTTAGNADYLRLQDGSPAVNSDSNDIVVGERRLWTWAGDVITDLAGMQRLIGSAVDIGAYESSIKSDQTITFTIADASTKKVGDAAVTLSTTSSIASLTAFTFASSEASVATVSGAQLSFVGAGTTTITASQAGDANYNTASAEVEVTVGKGDQTITFAIANADAKKVGDAAVTLSATSSVASLTAFTFASSKASVAAVSGAQLSFVEAGTTTITASQAGDANYNAASATVQVTVAAADPVVPTQSTSWGG